MLAPEMVVIVGLAVLLALVSAVAGAMWWRTRAVALVRVAQLARELAERLRVLEQIIELWEKTQIREAPSSSHPGGPRAAAAAVHRFDPPQPSAVAGPTLIAVPDLAAPRAAAPAAEASAELARRFGAVWQMAERGLAADAIARATGQPIGEVELVLGLRRQRAAVSEA
jgi:hypothetical protein